MALRYWFISFRADSPDSKHVSLVWCPPFAQVWITYQLVAQHHIAFLFSITLHIIAPLFAFHYMSLHCIVSAFASAFCIRITATSHNFWYIRRISDLRQQQHLALTDIRWVVLSTLSHGLSTLDLTQGGVSVDTPF